MGKTLRSVLVGLAVLYAGTAAAADPRATADVEPEVIAALDKMGTYLRTLQAFQIESQTTLDEVLTDGQKIQYAGTVNLLIRRPDRLRAQIESDRQFRMFLYDGKSFTMWGPRVGCYATVPAPATLAELDDRLAERYGIELPLRDLFWWGSVKARTTDITSAIDVGPSQVGGVTCEHYALREDGADWQIWIQNGDYPLPRKLVITTTTDDA